MLPSSPNGKVKGELTGVDIGDGQVPGASAVPDGDEARVEAVGEGRAGGREGGLRDGVVRGDELEGDDRVRLGDVDELGLELEAARADLDLREGEREQSGRMT